MKHQQRWIVSLIAAVISTGLSAGCDDRNDSAILPPPPPPAPTMGQQVQQPAPAPNRQIVWQLPVSWKEAPSTQPSEMLVQVSDQTPELMLKGKLLPKNEASTLVNIVNAWEKEIGKPPSDVSAVEGSIVKPYVSNGLQGHFVNITTPEGSESDKRLLGAIFPDPQGVIMSFTIAGPNQQVAAQQENFKQFIESLRVIEVPQQGPPPTGGAGPQAQASAEPTVPFRMQYQVPANWKTAPQSQGIDLDLRTGDPEKPIRLVVMRMGMDGWKRFLEDPNIMRTQAGLAPLPQGEKHQAYQVAIGPEQGIMFDFRNQPNEAPRRTLFAMAKHGGVVICIQLTGPAEQLDARLPDLEGFMKSLQFLPVNQ